MSLWQLFDFVVLADTGLASNSLGSYAAESPRADGFYQQDCVCVPYEQCQDLGRKEDGLLIDPRNLPTSIEAISDEVVVTDGNGTVISRHVKREGNATDEAEEENVSRKRREAPTDDQQVQPVSPVAINKYVNV